MRKIIATYFLFVLLGEWVFGQTYPFRTYSIENGLSEAEVYAIAQDKEGYIWIGTGFGLNRFDGLNFDSYFEEQGLHSSKIRSLLIDSKGKMWIGSVAGVNYMEADSIYTDPDLNSLNNSSVISIFEDSNGEMWFGTDGEGVWHYSRGFFLEQYSTSPGFKDNRIRSIIEDDNGEIWFATRNGLTVLYEGNFRTYTTEDGLPDNKIRDIAIDDSGIMWIATRSGLSRFNGKTFVNFGENEGLLDGAIQTISIDAEDGIWLGTEGGLSLFRDGKFKNFTVREGLTNDIIHSSLIDNEGNIWLGTYGGGLSLFLGDYIENYTTSDGLTNNMITSFAQDDKGNVWIGTYGGGLTYYTGGVFKSFDESNGLPDNRVYHTSFDSKKRLWIGMRDGLAYLQNNRLRTFTDKEFPFRKVRHVLESMDGTTIWISTYDDGLVKYNGKTYQQFDTQNGLPNNTVLATLEGNEGELWIATYGGVSKYSDGKFQNFGIQEGLPNNAVMSIIKDEFGTIWVSTFGGIAWFDGVRFRDITDEDGLPDRVCYFIAQDRNRNFWIGTNSGVVRFDANKYYSEDVRIQDQAFQVLTKEQGLISDELNVGGVFQDVEGHLWFGSVEGISHFNPALYKGNPVSPHTHILNLKASGHDYEPVNGLELSHERNFVEIHYAGINFTAPSQILYEYKLSGIDPDWQKTTARFAKYPSIPPGNYTFRVHARNTNGEWSEDMASIRFSINAPFWMQWWFFVLVFILIGSIILLFYNYYRVKKMVDIERMRVRIASDLHDDVGASLTEIALQSDFLQASSNNSEFGQSLTQIGQQCRRIVTSLDDIVWSIDARNDTLGDLTDRMQDYILNVLERKNMQILYDFDELKMDNKLSVVLKENLYLIFKEAVNNIAKYSNGDMVKISMKSHGGSYSFSISDNGTTGKGAKKTGHGLRNMEMRAERIGASINIEYDKGFTITLTGKINVN